LGSWAPTSKAKVLEREVIRGVEFLKRMVKILVLKLVDGQSTSPWLVNALAKMQSLVAPAATVDEDESFVEVEEGSGVDSEPEVEDDRSAAVSDLAESTVKALDRLAEALDYIAADPKDKHATIAKSAATTARIKAADIEKAARLPEMVFDFAGGALLKAVKTGGTSCADGLQIRDPAICLLALWYFLLIALIVFDSSLLVSEYSSRSA
jgi:hypothetical protein